jgi:hypothetical protein
VRPPGLGGQPVVGGGTQQIVVAGFFELVVDGHGLPPSGAVFCLHLDAIAWAFKTRVSNGVESWLKSC